jgi:hypothetical protein
MNLTTKLLYYTLNANSNAKTANIKFENGTFTYTPSDIDWNNLINMGVIDRNGNFTKKGEKFQILPDWEKMPSFLVEKIVTAGMAVLADRVYKGHILQDSLYENVDLLSTTIEVLNESLNNQAIAQAEFSEEIHAEPTPFEILAEIPDICLEDIQTIVTGEFAESNGEAKSVKTKVKKVKKETKA